MAQAPTFSGAQPGSGRHVGDPYHRGVIHRFARNALLVVVVASLAMGVTIAVTDGEDRVTGGVDTSGSSLGTRGDTLATVAISPSRLERGVVKQRVPDARWQFLFVVLATAALTALTIAGCRLVPASRRSPAFFTRYSFASRAPPSFAT